MVTPKPSISERNVGHADMATEHSAGRLGWEVAARTQDRLGESILWHPQEEALYWIDYYGPTVHRQRHGDGRVESWRIDRGELMGSLVFADKGRLILAVDHGLYLFDTADGSTRFFGDPKNGRMDLAYNDGKVDRAGRYWVGTYDLAESNPSAAFYRVAGNGSSSVADQGFVICNGPTFSPDNRKLYFSDTVGRRILSYEMDEGGGLLDRQTFFAFSDEDGMPDGLTVDSGGSVWCALYNGAKVVCIDASGQLRLSMPVPTRYVTSLCFGGQNLSTLYVTTGWGGGTSDVTKRGDLCGSVLMRPAEVPGLPEPIAIL
jgi:sugar lactone lactonase YvrE